MSPFIHSNYEQHHNARRSCRSVRRSLRHRNSPYRMNRSLSMRATKRNSNSYCRRPDSQQFFSTSSLESHFNANRTIYDILNASLRVTAAPYDVSSRSMSSMSTTTNSFAIQPYNKQLASLNTKYIMKLCAEGFFPIFDIKLAFTN